MELIDRSIQPPFRTIEHIDFIKARQHHLSNGISVYTVPAGNQDIVKIEFIFAAGIRYQHAPLIASCTNAMLTEGTKKHTSAEISEMLDYYGAYFGNETGKEYASLTLYTLTKYLESTVEIMAEVIKNPVFPEKEFETYLSQRRQSFQIEYNKVTTQAQRKFSEALYGKKHPLGKSAEMKDFDILNTLVISEFYRTHYTPERCIIVASGKTEQGLLDVLEYHFGESKWVSDKSLSPVEEVAVLQSARERKHFVEKNDAIQCALRIGNHIIGKKHPDFPALRVTTTVLGGYFGSRLMSNIREDKGYTYGIHAMLATMQQTSYFVIESEVRAEVYKPAIEEVYKEIKRMRTELVPEYELEQVRNYMLGNLLRTFDGPFNIADAAKGIILFGMGYDYFERMLEVIKNITPQQVLETANKYLIPDNMYEVVAGKKSV